MTKQLLTIGISFLAIAILLTVSLPGFADSSSNAKSDQLATKCADDEKILRDQAAQYAKAFAAGDAATIASMWTEDGTFTQPDGTQLHGRKAIESFFSSFFQLMSGQPLDVTVESIRFPEANVAIEEGTSRLSKGGQGQSMSRYTVLHVKRNGAWQMAAVSEVNCAQPSESASDSLKDLGWLVGSWTAKGASNMHLKATWSGQHKFINCQYQKDATSDPAGGDVQVIGWNPLNNRIASWHFHENGGFGYGRWMRDAETWTERARGVTPDGTICSATYTLKKLDNNNFQWQSTNRTMAGSQLPDTEVITVTRNN
jgi:uncharacterized protein (TIGR02246 family)